VTTAETLCAEGFAEGRAEGFAEGVAEVLVHMLTMNFGPVPEDVAETVHKTVRQAVHDTSVDDKSRQLIESCTDLGTLNRWFRRAFKADKGSDLFEE